MTGFSLTGQDQIKSIQSKIAKAITGVPAEVRAVNRRYVAIVRSTLIAHSSGRPGPNVVTGEYNANYVVQTTDDEMGVDAGNSSPQSDRLEHGFVEEDSLGRHYRQPPFPHFRPTLDEVGPQYVQDVAQAFPRWWRAN